jgi:hypothetical protein
MWFFRFLNLILRLKFTIYAIYPPRSHCLLKISLSLLCMYRDKLNAKNNSFIFELKSVDETSGLCICSEYMYNCDKSHILVWHVRINTYKLRLAKYKLLAHLLNNTTQSNNKNKTRCGDETYIHVCGTIHRYCNVYYCIFIKLKSSISI